jgi:hypothetical protein
VELAAEVVAVAEVAVAEAPDKKIINKKNRATLGCGFYIS